MYSGVVLNLVTGGSGFIGSNLVTRLLNNHEKVISIDNYSTMGHNVPKSEFSHVNLERFNFDFAKDYDTFDQSFLIKLKKEKIRIWHLAANSDIQNSATRPQLDYKNTLGTTLNVVEISNNFDVEKIYFASSSAVYGDHLGKQTSELEVKLLPTSNYGVMKLASELILLNYSRNKNLKIQIFRFPNVIGTPLTHGVINDFYNKLINLPKNLNVLGNGLQRKPFLHVDDLLEVMLSYNSDDPKIDVLNIGPVDDGIQIQDIAAKMRNCLSPNTELIYGETEGGWIGDVPKYSLNIEKMLKKLPNCRFVSRDAIEKVLTELELQ